MINKTKAATKNRVKTLDVNTQKIASKSNHSDQDFTQYCLGNFTKIASAAIEQAIAEANQAYPEAGIQLPERLPVNEWLKLETSNPKYNSKFYVAIDDGQACNPIATVHSFKHGGQNFTANPAWLMFTNQQPVITSTISQPKLKAVSKPQQTCPSCHKSHDGSFPTCYYCHIDSLYQKSKPQPHSYLKSKQIPFALIKNLGWRVHGQKLLIPLAGTDGYQVITANKKRYAVKTGLQDAHVTIGQIEAEGTIYVAEGLATAISSYSATGKPVVSTLDIKGLERTVKRLRVEYPQADIVILADNDIKENAPINPGVEKCAELSIKHGCRVAIPSLPTGEKCDFNDVHLSLGLEAVREQIETATLITSEQLKIIQDFLAAGVQVIVTNQPFQNDELIPNLMMRYFPYYEKLNISDRAALGTGKTTNDIIPISKLFETGRFYCHRQSLSRNLASVLGVDCYLDTDMNRDKLTMCINSIINKKWVIDVENLVVIDEVLGVKNAMFDGTVTARESTFTELQRQIEAAKVFLQCDADLTVNNRFRPDSDAKDIAIINLWKPYQDRQLISYPSQADIVAQLANDLRAGKQVALAYGCSIGKSKALIAEAIALSGRSDLKVANINRLTELRYAEFTENLANDSYTEFGIVAFSPIYGAGVDINDRTRQHFDAVYGLFEGQLDSKSIWQQIGRVRSQCPIHLYVPKAGNYSKLMTRQSLIDEQSAAQQAEIEQLKKRSDLVPPEFFDNFKFEVSPLIEQVIDWRLDMNNDKADLRNNVLLHGKTLGCQLTTAADFVAAKEIRSNIKERKQAIELSRAEEVITTHEETPLKSEFEVKVLEQRNRLSESDSDRLLAYKVAEFYRKPNINPQDVLNYEDDREASKRLRWMLLGEEEAETLAIEELSNTDKLWIDRKAILTRFKFQRLILTQLGATWDDIDDIDLSNVTYDHETLWSSQIPEILRKNRAVLNGCGMGATVTNKVLTQWETDEDGNQKACNGLQRYIKHVLDNCGLNVVGQQIREGQARKRIYRVDLAEFERLKDLSRVISIVKEESSNMMCDNCKNSAEFEGPNDLSRVISIVKEESSNMMCDNCKNSAEFEGPNDLSRVISIVKEESSNLTMRDNCED